MFCGCLSDITSFPQISGKHLLILFRRYNCFSRSKGTDFLHFLNVKLLWDVVSFFTVSHRL